MIEILVQLEYRRRALRRRALRKLAQSDERYFAVGGMLFAIAAFIAPLFPGTLPPLSILAGSVIIFGGVLLFTVILIPAGLFLL